MNKGESPSKAADAKKQHDSHRSSSSRADSKSGKGVRAEDDIDGVPIADAKQSSVAPMKNKELFTKSNIVPVSSPTKGSRVPSTITISSKTTLKLQQDKTDQNVKKAPHDKYNRTKPDATQPASTQQDAKNSRQANTSSRNRDPNPVRDRSQSNSRQSSSSSNGSNWRDGQRNARPDRIGGGTGRNDYNRSNLSDHRNKFSNEARRDRR